MTHVQRLADGPLAIIGDIHGELEALDALLAHLDRDHPNTRLVFLGDLADRGPDSPGVIQRVRERVERGAQCVLGNHELSVLRGRDKKYNRWFFPEEGDWCPAHTHGKVVPMTPIDPDEKPAVREFFATMPLVLERDDLRVVHACWDDDAVAHVRGDSRSAHTMHDAMKATNPIDEPAALSVHGDGSLSRDLEWEANEQAIQKGNPVAVLTSGKERPATHTGEIVWSGGRWRPLVRDRWWDRYHSDIPVVIGHYSRMWDPTHQDDKTQLMFGGAGPTVPVGPRRNVYCVDFAVGTRYEERADGRTQGFAGRLAALLWDDGPRRLVFDDGEVVRMEAGGGLA